MSEVPLHLSSDGRTAQTAPGYRGTSLIINSALLGPFSSTMHRALWWVLGGGRFFMSKVPLYRAYVDDWILAHYTRQR